MSSTSSTGAAAAPQTQAMQAREAAPPPLSQYQQLATPPASGFAPGVLPSGPVHTTHPQGMAGHAYPMHPPITRDKDWATNLVEAGCIDGESCWWSLWCPLLLFQRTTARFDLVKSPLLFFCLMIAAVLIAAAIVVALNAVAMATGKYYSYDFIWPIVIASGFFVACRTYYRGKIRAASGIMGSPVEDLIITLFFSPCAMAQEARQANAEGRPVKEFVTGDVLPPFSEDPTATGDISFFSTLRRASRFSFLLLTSMFLLLVLCAGGMIYSCHTGRISLTHAILSIFTLLQPLVVLYLVYWRQHRKEASLDVVIKLFATGLFFTYISCTIIKQAGEQPIAFMSQWGDIVNKVLGPFFLAFTTIAVWEEVFKYFGLRYCMLGGPVRSPHTILIYLISAALGFACAENIVIFLDLAFPKVNPFNPIAIWSPYMMQDTVLALRPLMPVHVICAALQAVQWVNTAAANRPLSVFPVITQAFFLNGLFKFVLMMLAGILYHGERVDKETADAISSIIGFIITFVGLYVANRQWCAQQERLRTAGTLPGAVEITNGRAQGGSGEVAMVMRSGFEQNRDQAASAKGAASIYPQAGATESELVIVTPTLHEREGGPEIV